MFLVFSIGIFIYLISDALRGEKGCKIEML